MDVSGIGLSGNETDPEIKRIRKKLTAYEVRLAELERENVSSIIINIMADKINLLKKELADAKKSRFVTPPGMTSGKQHTVNKKNENENNAVKAPVSISGKEVKSIKERNRIEHVLKVFYQEPYPDQINSFFPKQRKIMDYRIIPERNEERKVIYSILKQLDESIALYEQTTAEDTGKKHVPKGMENRKPPASSIENEH